MADDAEHAAWLDQQLGEQEVGCAAEPSAGVATAEHVGAGTLHAPAAVPPLPARTRIQGLAVCTRRSHFVGLPSKDASQVLGVGGLYTAVDCRHAQIACKLCQETVNHTA